MWKTIVQYSSKANSGFVDSQGRHSWEMSNVSVCRLVQAVLLKCWSFLRASGAVDTTWCWDDNCSFLQPEVWQQVSVGSSVVFHTAVSLIPGLVDASLWEGWLCLSWEHHLELWDLPKCSGVLYQWGNKSLKLINEYFSGTVCFLFCE